MTQTVYFRTPSHFWHRLTALSLGLGLLSLTLVAPAIAESKAQISGTSLHILSVTGKGKELIPTTLSKIQLGVEFQGKTAAEVQPEVARRSAAVVALLRSRQVQKLETTGIQLNPIYSYENNQQRLTGYVGTNTVSFKVDTAQAGAIMDDAVKAGATRIDNITFVAAETAIAAAQKQALREATQDAQEQANAVLSALNLSSKEIVGIQINAASPPAPIMLEAVQFRAKVANATTPVVGGEQEVNASVTLQISY